MTISKRLRCGIVAAAAALAAAAGDVPQTLGDVSTFSCSGATCDIVATVANSAATVPLRLVFFSNNIVRWWLAVDGNFSENGAFDDVVVGGAEPVTVALADSGAYYQVSAPSSPVVARVQKSPALLSLLVNGVVVAQEAAPLSWNSTSSWQTLARDAGPKDNLSAEYFFGGGMQNGRFSHRDEAIVISVSYNWEDGGNPNPAPWYVSSAGYGVFRNTWAPGVYTFQSPVVTVHNESNRLDAFFLLPSTSGPASIKSVLGLYTQLTGPPFLPPLYGLYLGDSDCYHNDRHGNSTQTVLGVAKGYEDNDMPRGWALVNDGYGCGYGEPADGAFPSNITDLAYVIAQLHTYGLYSGLWTSTGMPNISSEVGFAGSRVCKTDVGWIGAGYKYAFDGVTLCASGIEQYSPARRFVWTVEGWAGTHRLAVMWSGDDSGDMDYVRWQMPTFVGSGFSAQAHVSGDIDGIFGGSPESQVRDFQFKSVTTTLMVMSGWAANPDKQPWTWGEPYTTFNRASLKFKSQLTPYIYSYSRIAHDTGVPPVRSPLLEFPGDEPMFIHSNLSSYEFMSGEWLLAAPVYTQGAVTRDGIYLPGGAGQIWLDYWDGTRYAGGQTLDGYPAPLSTLPLFVRAGAIIPQIAPNNFFNEKPWDPMYLELWPAGNTSFALYEDDGVSREALPPGSAYATTTIAVSAPAAYLNSSSSANVTISVSAAQGTFTGQLKARGWWMNIRAKSSPIAVLLSTTAGGPAVALPQFQSEPELEVSPAGWYYSTSLQQGLLMVKVSNVSASVGFTVTLSAGVAYPKIGTEACDTPSHHQVENQKFAFSPSTGQIVVIPVSSSAGANASQCVTVGVDKDPDSHTPAVEVQPCDASLVDKQTFVHLAQSNQFTLKSDGSTCLDQDVSDNRVIAYSCHDPSSPGNQAWSVNPDGTNHIISLVNGLCMAVFPPQ